MRRIVFASALFVTACVAESARGPGTRSPQAASDAPTCQDEQATGTNIARRVCRSPEQRHDEEMARQSWMNGWHPNPMRGDFTYPGLDARHPSIGLSTEPSIGPSTEPSIEPSTEPSH